MYDNNLMEDEDDSAVNTEDIGDDDGWWMKDTVAALNVSPPVTMSSNLTCKTAIDIMKRKGIDQIPIMNNDEIYGVVSVGNLSSKLLKGRVSPNDKVTEATFKKFKKVSLTTKLTKLSQIFNVHHFVLVVTESEHHHNEDSSSKKQMVVGIITRIDLLNYIVKGHPKEMQDIE